MNSGLFKYCLSAVRQVSILKGLLYVCGHFRAKGIYFNGLS